MCMGATQGCVLQELSSPKEPSLLLLRNSCQSIVCFWEGTMAEQHLQRLSSVKVQAVRIFGISASHCKY